jgi:hypothetical protein
VEIMAEVDRKIDDGNPDAGGFQFSLYYPTGFAQVIASPNGCINASTAWDITGGVTNCGAASLF